MISLNDGAHNIRDPSTCNPAPAPARRHLAPPHPMPRPAPCLAARAGPPSEAHPPAQPAPSVELGGARYPTPLSRAPPDTAPPRGEAGDPRSMTAYPPPPPPPRTRLPLPTLVLFAPCCWARTAGPAGVPDSSQSRLKPPHHPHS